MFHLSQDDLTTCADASNTAASRHRARSVPQTGGTSVAVQREGQMTWFRSTHQNDVARVHGYR